MGMGSNQVWGAGVGHQLSAIFVCEVRKCWSKSCFYFQLIPAKTTPAACWSDSAARSVNHATRFRSERTASCIPLTRRRAFRLFSSESICMPGADSYALRQPLVSTSSFLSTDYGRSRWVVNTPSHV